MPDVISVAPERPRLWVALDVHKLSIVAATLPPAGGQPDVACIETTEKAIRRFIDRLGGPTGLAVCYEAGPGGFAASPMATPSRPSDSVSSTRICSVRAVGTFLPT